MIERRTISRSLQTGARVALIPLVAAFLAGVQPVAAADAVRLRYGLRAGATYDGSMTTSMTITMAMEGLPEDAAAMLGTVGKDLHQEISVKTRLAVGEA